APRRMRRALIYIGGFPDGYRARTAPEEGAADILRLCALESDADRDVRITPLETGDARQLRLKMYRRGGLIPLSDAVPVLENFGLRVLEEMPTARTGGIGHIHDVRVEVGGEADIDAILQRIPAIDRPIAGVLRDAAEADEFNQLIPYAVPDT